MAKKRSRKQTPVVDVVDVLTEEQTREAMELLNSPWGNHLVSQAIQICLWNIQMEPLRYNENPESDLFKVKLKDLQILKNVLFPSYAQLQKTVDQHAIELKMSRMSQGEKDEIMESAIIQP